MSLQARITTNTISPRIGQLARGLKDKRPILEAMGLALVSHAKRSFNAASLRAASWPAKKDGTPSNLKQTGALWQSLRITNLSPASVTVGSDRPYAAVHQFGGRSGRTGRMPARPFLPFLSGRLVPSAEKSIAAAAEAKIKALAQ